MNTNLFLKKNQKRNRGGGGCSVSNPCTCKEWKESINQIIGAQHLASLHGIDYTGKEMTHCPWCGKKLSGSTRLDEITKRVLKSK